MNSNQRRQENRKFKNVVIIDLLEKNKRRRWEPLDWCEEKFGPGGTRWRIRYDTGTITYRDEYQFVSEKDAIIFAIRWL